MNVLSLFDGMRCGHIAFKELGIPIDTYYASEVDKWAIEQASHVFPGDVNLGDVRNIDVSKLKPIDVLIGGSPCQSFSFAGKRKGMSTKSEIEILTLDQYLELKEQDFEFEGQSYLFWEYMRILTDIRKYNPDVLFLLENVEMSKKWERTLSEAIGVCGVHINSARVSAQNRKRIYWTNIKTKPIGLFEELHSDIPQPKDKGILLKDILQPESEVDNKFYIKNPDLNNRHLLKNIKEKDVKADAFLATSYKGAFANGMGVIKCDKKLKPKANQDKASCFTAGGNSGGNHSDMDVLCVSMVGRRIDENGVRKDNDKSKEEKKKTLI